MRELTGKGATAIAVLYCAFVGWSLYGAIWPVETYAFRMVHMAFIFALAFVLYPVAPKAPAWTIWFDVLLAVLGVACIAYAFIDMDQFITFKMKRLQELINNIRGIGRINAKSIARLVGQAGPLQRQFHMMRFLIRTSPIQHDIFQQNCREGVLARIEGRIGSRVRWQR